MNIDTPTAIQAKSIPPARRPRRNRPGPDRLRQDPRLRAADHRGVDTNTRETQALVLAPTRELARQVGDVLDAPRQAPPASASPSSTAASATSPRSERSANGAHDRRRHARPRAGPPQAAHAASSTASASSSSTRRTRCSTAASRRTSSASSRMTPRSRQTALFSATTPDWVHDDRQQAPERPGHRQRSTTRNEASPTSSTS